MEIKRNKFTKEYLEKSNKNSVYQQDLLLAVKKINSVALTANNIDFVDYNLYLDINNEPRLENQINLLCKINKIIPEYTIAFYIKYLFDHDFIDISKSNKSSFSIVNPRYGSVVSVIKQKSSVDGFMELAHELGYSYFSSFIKNKNIVNNMPGEMKLLFSFINKCLAVNVLVRFKKSISKEEIISYIERTVSTPYSLDLYEEKVFTSIKLLDWDKIISFRKQVIKNINPTKHFLN